MTFSKDLMMATHNGEDFVFMPCASLFSCLSCALMPDPRNGVLCYSPERKCRGAFRPDGLDGCWKKKCKGGRYAARDV